MTLPAIGRRRRRSDATVTDTTVTTVTVTPSTATLAARATRQLTATATNAEGQTVSGASIAWASDDETVATVSTAGLVTWVSDGTCTITASSGTPSDTCAVTCSVDTVVAAVSVSPATASVDVDATTALTATATNAAGDTVAGATIAWSSSDTDIATVDTDGTVTGVAAGDATITATSNGHSDTCAVTVSAAATDDWVLVYTSDFSSVVEDTELSTFDSDWTAGNGGQIIIRAASQRLEGGSANTDCLGYAWEGLNSPTGKQAIEFKFTAPSGATSFLVSAEMMLSADKNDWYEFERDNSLVGVSAVTGGASQRFVATDTNNYVADTVHTLRAEADPDATGGTGLIFKIDDVAVLPLTTVDTNAARITSGHPGLGIFPFTVVPQIWDIKVYRWGAA